MQQNPEFNKRGVVPNHCGARYHPCSYRQHFVIHNSIGKGGIFRFGSSKPERNSQNLARIEMINVDEGREDITPIAIFPLQKAKLFSKTMRFHRSKERLLAKIASYIDLATVPSLSNHSLAPYDDIPEQKRFDSYHGSIFPTQIDIEDDNNAQFTSEMEESEASTTTSIASSSIEELPDKVSIETEIINSDTKYSKEEIDAMVAEAEAEAILASHRSHLHPNNAQNPIISERIRNRRFQQSRSVEAHPSHDHDVNDVPEPISPS